MATTKQKTLFKFTVVGSGVFPFDMLRYDQCWPASENDSAAIERTSRRGSHMRDEKITLASNIDRTTGARWVSFGWRVVE